MICPKCGTEVGDAKFCTNCGAPVNVPQTPVQEPAQQPPVQEAASQTPVQEPAQQPIIQATAQQQTQNQQQVTRKKTSLLKIILLVAAVLILMRMCRSMTSHSSTSQSEPVKTAVPTAVPTAEPTPEPTEAPKLTVDEVMSDIDSRIKETLGNAGADYSVTKHENVVMVSIWSEDITNTAQKAVQNAEDRKTWDANAETLLKLQGMFQNMLDENGHSDHTVMLNIWNATNRDRYLLVIANGEVLYDAVNGINKLV